MRIGVLAFLHESNTLVSKSTRMEDFEQDLLIEGGELLNRLKNSHHEVGGFLGFLQQDSLKNRVEIVPLLAARALPSGPIETKTFQVFVEKMCALVDQHRPLDGLLIAAHGAAVCQTVPDADGLWLTELRRRVGDIPIVATLDPHANLSSQMASACNALIAYRTNPHLDQRQRGEEAARLLVRTIEKSVRPTMAVRFPPLAINIERQFTSSSPLKELFEFADQQLTRSGVLGNSIILGFPYADVREMGASVIVITDNDQQLADQLVDELAERLWSARSELVGELHSIEEVLAQCEQENATRYCLLDMGDNAGGGSAPDGTWIVEALMKHRRGPSFACLKDEQAVAQCVAAGTGVTLKLEVGGKTDSLHGPTLTIEAKVVSLHSGVFEETQPRHGGMTKFDQGTTAIVQVTEPQCEMTLMLTSNRMVPFSLKQLTTFGIDPTNYRYLVAKGVHAPVAAYRDVCDRLIRVNTPGSTCADLNQINFLNRRVPLFPFEDSAKFGNAIP